MRFLINSLSFLLTLLGLTSGAKWEVTGWHLHRLVPNDQGQVNRLKELRNSNSGVSFNRRLFDFFAKSFNLRFVDTKVMFWNGIGAIGNPVDILGSKVAFEHLQEQLGNKQLGTYEYNQYIRVNLISSDVNVNLNNDIAATEPHPPPTEPLFPHSANLIPIQPIDNTSLYSGLFYRIRMLSFPRGWVTWTTKETQNKEGNYIQIDNNPKNLPFYMKGEKWYEDIQWAFIPSEKEGYYTLTLKGNLNAMATSTFEQQSGYNHVVLAKARDFIRRISLGGEKRDSALWKPISAGADYSGYTQLKLKSFMGLPSHKTAFVTWTAVKYGDFSHYIQVSTNPKNAPDHLPKYSKGGEWYNDTLFQFIPTDIKLYGVVSSLQFSEDDSKPLNYERLVVKQFKLKNNGPTKVNYNFTEKVSLANELGLDLFKDIVEMEKYLDGPVELEASLPRLVSDEKFHRKGFDVRDTTESLSRKTEFNEYTLRKEIELGPKSGGEVTVYADRIGGNIPLNALLCIKGTTDRIVGDLSTVQEGSVGVSVVRDELQRRGYKKGQGEVMMTKDAVCLWAQGMIQGRILVDAGISLEAGNCGQESWGKAIC